MEAEGVDALFLAPSADLEYLTGVERQVPNFGEASYAHGWVTGAFFRPGADPVFLFPRMFAAFDLREDPDGEVVVVSETDDGSGRLRARRRAASGRDDRRRRPRLGRDGAQPRPRRRLRPSPHRLEARQRAAPREDGRGARGDGPRDRDRRADDGRGRAARRARRVDARPGRGGRARAARRRLALPVVHHAHVHRPRRRRLRLGHRDRAPTRSPRARSVMFDFGGVVDGYCSDFGRTIYCGEPPDDYREVYAVMLAAQEAGSRGRERRDARARGQRRLPAADRGGRARRALPPPHGPRHRHGRARAAVHLHRGRDAARAGHDLHRRALDHHPGPLQPPDRGHRRVRGERRAQAQRYPAALVANS